MKNLLILPILILAISISHGQWTTTNLSEAKDGMGAAAFPAAAPSGLLGAGAT
jgi:hypothetical protein